MLIAIVIFRFKPLYMKLISLCADYLYVPNLSKVLTTTSEAIKNDVIGSKVCPNANNEVTQFSGKSFVVLLS